MFTEHKLTTKDLIALQGRITLQYVILWGTII